MISKFKSIAPSLFRASKLYLQADRKHVYVVLRRKKIILQIEVFLESSFPERYWF